MCIRDRLEGYGSDNPGSKSQGMKQLMAGGGIILLGTTLIPLPVSYTHLADFTGTDDSHDLFKLGNLPCVGGLVPQHPYMVWQAASVNIVGPLAQQIEHLRKGQSHKEIIGLVPE